MSKYQSTGYVVERWVSAEKLLEEKEQYTQIKLNIGDEKWETLIKDCPIFDKYRLGEVEPHWMGIKGGAHYSWAREHRDSEMMKTDIMHRVVKAGFPHKDSWMGYTIIPWNFRPNE